MFEKLKAEIASDTPGFQDPMSNKMEHHLAVYYAVFQGLWDEARDVARESDVHARIIGVQATMTKF